MKKFSAALRSFALALITCAVATAHQVDSVELEFLTPEGKWQFEGLLDISYMMPDTRGVAGALPKLRTDVMNAPKQEHDRIVAAAEKTMRSLLTLKFNGEELSWKIRFPDFETEPLVLPTETGDWALMRTVIATTARPGPGKLEVFWNDNLASELIVIIEEGENLGLLSISSGMSETVLSLGTPTQETAALSQETPSKWAQFGSWIISGYHHVIPLGLDHLLFIFGLFLLAPRWKPLLGQSLLFTVAHSITLALAIFQVISLPPILVEILIAASIAWIGIENLIMKELKASRLVLVFGFGLLHGLGFASVLREKLGDLTGSALALPLVSFNLGVELAQVTVLTASFLLLWPLRRHTRKFQTIGSIFVALAGLFWMGERILAAL